jgi:5'-nucleotidase/UDP-sugar diphosphatase
MSFAAACLLFVAAPACAQATITILHFNDVYEITPVEAGKAGGLARLARFRAELKAQHPELLTTLGGDYVSPSALGTARVNGERLAGKQMVAVLNLVGLDWATFGNHEFDIPEAALRARLAESTFRMVSSNVTDASGALYPNTVRTAVVPVKTPSGTVRVGLLGLTIDANKQAWVRYAPPIESARAAVSELKGKCDVIVALTHLALAGDQEVAEQVPEIDLILGGHEHENWVIERGAHFTPIIKADANVRTVAVVTIQIQSLPRPGGGAPRPSAGQAAKAGPIITARLQRIDERMKEGPRTAAGVKKWVDLGYQGFRADGFEPTQLVTTIDVALDGREAAVRNHDTNLTDLIVDAMRHEAATDVGLFNAGSVRIDDVLPPGPITQYDVIRVLPFGGKVVKATFTGALLARVLQVGASNIGTGGFLHYTGPKPADPAARYTLAISDFLLTGGEANLGFLTRQNPEITNVTDLRDIRLAVIEELKRRFALRSLAHRSSKSEGGSLLQRDAEPLGHPIERSPVHAENLDSWSAVLGHVRAAIDPR